MNKILKAENDCQRLDIFLSEALQISRSHAKKIVEEGLVSKDGRLLSASSKVKSGEEFRVEIKEPEQLDLTPQDIPIEIIYQDEDVAVINKPQGLTVHSGGGTNGGTLVNALLYHLDSLSSINGIIRPGIVHRIDKDTSGLLVVAKNDKAHLSLSEQISTKLAKRYYIALLEGVLKQDNGVITTKISRSKTDRKMMAVSSDGRIATTLFNVKKRYAHYTLCEFELKTGRTHQIRVHSKHIGHPIVGDKTYGYKKQKFELKGQLLHAYKLVFKHPSTNEEMEFFAPIPDYFNRVLEILDKTDKEN